MATIKEIAKLANVSIATVSNVLNQKPGSASPEKVEKVLKVAKSLNYRPQLPGPEPQTAEKPFDWNHCRGPDRFSDR